jgi:hypothetical protein
VRAINAAQGVSGLLSAQEQWEQGNYLAAALDATGSVFNFTQLFKACFTGDVKLLARGSWGEGWRRIDEITTEDEVLSRDEHDSSGPLAWKKVEETFERVGLVLELEVGGRMIIWVLSIIPFWMNWSLVMRHRWKTVAMTQRTWFPSYELPFSSPNCLMAHSIPTQGNSPTP